MLRKCSTDMAPLHRRAGSAPVHHAVGGSNPSRRALTSGFVDLGTATLWLCRRSYPRSYPRSYLRSYLRLHRAAAEGEHGPVDLAGVTAAAWAAGGPARLGSRPAASPGVAARRRGRRRRGPPAGFGCRRNSGTPVLKGEVGAEQPAGRGRPAGRPTRTGECWRPRWRRRGGRACPWRRSGRGRRPEAGRSSPSSRRRCAAGAGSGSGNARRCRRVLPAAVQTRGLGARGLGEGVVVSARHRKDERALVQLTRRSARSPSRALGTATTVTSWPTARSRRGPAYGINLAALRFVPCEDLQAEGYGAYRNLLNQAATTKGAKR
jgi:hypothetical protein